jgi:RHS repeat-associated protein
MAMDGAWQDIVNGPENNYLYNGIEKTSDFGLDWDMAMFRSYDPSIGRWTQVDPLAELRPDMTPYRFGFNNPMLYSDPLGLFETKREARRARRRARRQGNDVGKLYKSGDEWGFSTGEGAETVHNFTKDYKVETFTEKAPDPKGVNYATGIFGDWRTWTKNGANWEVTRDYHSVRSAKAATTIVTALTPLKIGGVPGWVGRTAGGLKRFWPAASNGRVTINGIEYTIHALERMQPVGTIMNGKKVFSRGVPPSVVEHAIKYGEVAGGNTAGVVVRTFENVTVVTNPAGTRVITVIKTGH